MLTLLESRETAEWVMDRKLTDKNSSSGIRKGATVWEKEVRWVVSHANEHR